MIFRVNINIQRMEPVASFFFSLVFRSYLMPLLFLLARCGRNLSLTTKTCFWLSSRTHISSQPVYKKRGKKCLDSTIRKHVFAILPFHFFSFGQLHIHSAVPSSLPICSRPELICMRQTWSGDATAEAQAGLGLTGPPGSPGDKGR